MTINSYASSGYFSYASYQTTGNYNDSSTTQSYESIEQKQGGPRGQGGPPPPPKGGKAGPDLDSDEDGLWSTDELESFASSATSEFGINVDVDQILTDYDVDGDGAINSDERVALKENNGFNLPSPKEMMAQMRGFSPPPRISTVSEDQTSSTIATESSTSSQLVQQLLEAYKQQSYDFEEELLTSTLTYQL